MQGEQRTSSFARRRTVYGAFTNLPALSFPVLPVMLKNGVETGLCQMFIRGSSRPRYRSAMRGRAILAILMMLLALSAPAGAQWRRPPFGPGVQRLDRILPGIRSAHPG